MENPWRGRSKVNPQVEGKGAHFRRINTEILRAMIRAGLSGGEWAITMAVIDETWGKCLIYGPISIGRLVEKSGLSRRGVTKTVKKLIARRILVGNHSSLVTEYLVNKHFDTWIGNHSSLDQLGNHSSPKLVNSSSLPSKSRPINRNIKQKTPYISPPLGEFKNVCLTQEQFDKLKVKFGDTTSLDKIENLSTYLEQIGPKKSKAKYKSHYATILNWDRMDKKRTPQGARPTSRPTCKCGIFVNQDGALCPGCEESND